MKPIGKVQIFIMITFSMVVLFFNNCSQQQTFTVKDLNQLNSEGVGGGSGAGTQVGDTTGLSNCDLQLMEQYRQTWFTILPTSCGLCHSSQHGSNILANSYKGFKVRVATYGEARVKSNATTRHQGRDFSANAAVVNSWAAKWAAASSEYNLCK